MEIVTKTYHMEIIIQNNREVLCFIYFKKSYYVSSMFIVCYGIYNYLEEGFKIKKNVLN